MDTQTLLETYSTLGATGFCVVFLGYMLVNLIRSQREQSDDLEEIKTSISKQETELTSTYQICVKLIDSINAFKQSTNDKMDRRHESLMKEVDDLSDKISYMSGRLNGGSKH